MLRELVGEENQQGRKLDENWERTENGKDYEPAHRTSAHNGNQFSEETNGKSDRNAGGADNYKPTPKS